MNFAFLETSAAGGSMWTSIIMMALIILVFWFFIIRPQRKKDKETAKMCSELQVGDEIVTIGGIIGIIVSMKEDSLVIETGSDRSKVRLARWAISGKNTTAEPK
jgi:preprotein translocase subunit YajC